MAKKNDPLEDSSSKGEESLKKAPMPPLPFARHIREGKKEEKKGGGTSAIDAALKMIEEMQKKQDEIDLKFDEIIQKTGWTPKEVKAYLENPNNFSPETWERINQERESLMKQFHFREENEGKSSSQAEKESKGRRGKRAGGRRNWIPIR